jgi:hypothetical protein
VCVYCVVRPAALSIISVILCLGIKEEQIIKLHTIGWFFVVSFFLLHVSIQGRIKGF